MKIVVGEDGLIPAMFCKAPSILKTADLLSASPRPAFDVFSYPLLRGGLVPCASMGPRVLDPSPSQPGLHLYA
jgi:hypothetical protein